VADLRRFQNQNYISLWPKVRLRSAELHGFINSAFWNNAMYEYFGENELMYRSKISLPSAGKK
jgi:hypothetical protein